MADTQRTKCERRTEHFAARRSKVSGYVSGTCAFGRGSDGLLKRPINAEFLRITTVPLQTRFLASLDKHYSKLIELIRRKAGVIREKTQEILKVLDLSLEANIKRECLLKCLILYLGEDPNQMIKEYLIVQRDEAETELASSTLAVFVMREDFDSLQPPQDIGIVVEDIQPLRAQCCSVSVRALQSHSHTNNTMSLMSLQLFLLALGLLVRASSGEISLTQTPKAAAVDKGASVTIRCQSVVALDDDLAWYLQKGTEPPKLLIYNAVTLVSGVSSRFSGSGYDYDFTLTISGFDVEDAGVYYCQQYEATPFTQ
ncbi:hypothetical protein WMY93_019070 [Mugilogobius chulae]|uniref:Ig-like domain-containing protein n=1 Tax=Mugilogobius chulae TaxID=88201 RepID=A0AAW0NP50_9GOBI